MAVTLEQFGLNRLPPDERMELVGLLWESLGEGGFTPPDGHIRELDRRIAAADADPVAAIPWEEFRAEWLGDPYVGGSLINGSGNE